MTAAAAVVIGGAVRGCEGASVEGEFLGYDGGGRLKRALFFWFAKP